MWHQLPPWLRHLHFLMSESQTLWVKRALPEDPPWFVLRESECQVLWMLEGSAGPECWRSAHSSHSQPPPVTLGQVWGAEGILALRAPPRPCPRPPVFEFQSRLCCRITGNQKRGPVRALLWPGYRHPQHHFSATAFHCCVQILNWSCFYVSAKYSTRIIFWHSMVFRVRKWACGTNYTCVGHVWFCVYFSCCLNTVKIFNLDYVIQFA